MLISCYINISLLRFVSNSKLVSLKKIRMPKCKYVLKLSKCIVTVFTPFICYVCYVSVFLKKKIFVLQIYRHSFLSSTLEILDIE